MAYFFLPSSFQKRLLRYALSRLQLLDTDALELENLDIAWGQRSTVELRDVGLRLKVSNARWRKRRVARGVSE
jgi:autophagy-related protein 2